MSEYYFFGAVLIALAFGGFELRLRFGTRRGESSKVRGEFEKKGDQVLVKGELTKEAAPSTGAPQPALPPPTSSAALPDNTQGPTRS